MFLIKLIYSSGKLVQLSPFRGENCEGLEIWHGFREMCIETRFLVCLKNHAL